MQLKVSGRKKENLVVNILALLEKNPMHGYGIAKVLKARGFQVSWGELYPLLREMEKKGLVKSRKEGRRKIYRITEPGRNILREKLKTSFFDVFLEIKELFDVRGILGRLWSKAVSLALAGKREELEAFIDELRKFYSRFA